MDVGRYIPGVSVVKFIETYTIRPAKKEEAKAEEKEDKAAQEQKETEKA